VASTNLEQHCILIADDDDAMRAMLVDLLQDEGYEVLEARNGSEVLTQVAAHPEVNLLLMDVVMPDMDGIETLERLRKQGYEVPVIVMTAQGTSSTAIRAIQMGAHDYMLKTLLNDDVLIRVRRLFEYQQLATRVKNLEKDGQDPRDRIIGNSPAMQAVYRTVGLSAGSNASVLITGETGTGKELVADTIHRNSRRKDGPIIKVNCGALPETLLESELFGHEKGSFTGALAQRRGRFELAHKGTIFLDEVGELTPAAQKKLLRVLQEGEFERVGGSVTVKVDVRVIAATNRDLLQEVAEGNFREDLYYRLNVVHIQMPALREREDDITLLVQHFLYKYRYQPGSPPSRITEEALQKLADYHWPGNVRQLENEIERAVVFSQGQVITDKHVLNAPPSQAAFIDVASRLRQGASFDELLRETERALVSEAMRQSDNIPEIAARKLGLDLARFEGLLERYQFA
jgi:two-component system, NtrC family, response regulator AtoC